MRSATQILRRWEVTGFRRYRPENAIGRGMIEAAPWVTVALLVMGYLALAQPYVLQPGIRVSLPEAPLAAGTRYGLNLVVLAPEPASGQARDEIVFFDDRRFLVRDPAQMDALRGALGRGVRARPGQPMVIEADQQVLHGTVVRLLAMAQDAGLADVHLATRPP